MYINANLQKTNMSKMLHKFSHTFLLYVVLVFTKPVSLVLENLSHFTKHISEYFLKIILVAVFCFGMLNIWQLYKQYFKTDFIGCKKCHSSGKYQNKYEFLK